MDVSIKRIVTVILLVLGILGTSYPANAAVGITGFIAMEGPEGEQIVVYCVGGAYQYTVRLDASGLPVYSGNLLISECSVDDLYRGHHGYSVVINTSLLERWVVDPFNPRVAEICHTGMLTTLTGNELGAPPDLDPRFSERCTDLRYRGA